MEKSVADARERASTEEITTDARERGAESSGMFPGGSWRLYPMREAGRVTGHMLHVRVGPDRYKKARLPKDAELSTAKQREAWCAEAAPIIFEEFHREAAKAAKAPSNAEPQPIGFFDLADLWTSGKLHEQYPDHVRKKKEASAEADAARFTFMEEVLGERLALRDFTLDHGEKIMRAIPRDRSPSTRRHMAQVMMKLLAYAVFPCRLIASSPLPRGFLPRLGAGKAKGHLYPDEEAALIGCTKLRDDGTPLVPLWRRVYFAFLTREGMREGEALRLCWSDLDLVRGAVVLDENKTDDPRSWALAPDVVEALKAWKKLHPDPKPTSLVFVTSENVPIDAKHLPRSLLADLRAAGVDRPELHATTKTRRRLRVHDLRATFVTVSLANGKTETWVADRTGHRSSAMINRYRRAARTWTELDLGELKPMHTTIPELAPKAPTEPQPPQSDPDESGEAFSEPFSETDAAASMGAESAAIGSTESSKKTSAERARFELAGRLHAHMISSRPLAHDGAPRLRLLAGNTAIEAQRDATDPHRAAVPEQPEKAPERAIAIACLALLDAGLVDEARAVLRSWVGGQA